MRIPMSLLLALLVIGGLRAAADEAPVPRNVAVDVTLAGGNVHGSAASEPLTLRTDYGRLALPLARIERLSLDANGETVSCRMRNGDVLHGVLETESFALFELGRTTPWPVPCADIRSLRVVPPLRIAGSGDAWWDVAFRDARGWTAANEGGRLVVTAIDPVKVHGRGGEAPCQVRLTREVETRDDFDLDVSLSWDAGAAGKHVMHNLYVSLLDGEGRLVAAAGHNDAWDGETGSRYSRVAGHDLNSGWGTQPMSGRMGLAFARRDGCLKVLFDGEKHQAGESRAAIRRVQVDFEFYPYEGPGGKSAFGTLTLDRLALR
jgi:hypothetical protein